MLSTLLRTPQPRRRKMFQLIPEPFTTGYILSQCSTMSYNVILIIPFNNEFYSSVLFNGYEELVRQEYQEQTSLFRTNIILSSPSHGNSHYLHHHRKTVSHHHYMERCPSSPSYGKLSVLTITLEQMVNLNDHSLSQPVILSTIIASSHHQLPS